MAHTDASSAPERWIVDGNNVVGSRPDGWWRDRPGAFRRLLGAVLESDWPGADGVLVVFDGPADPTVESVVGDGSATRVSVLFAGRGRSADDAIVEATTGNSAGGLRQVVVTSDRALADRVRASGAEVVSAGAFLRRLKPA